MASPSSGGDVASSSLQINITRPVYTEESFAEQFMKFKKEETNRSVWGRITRTAGNILGKLRCTRKTAARCFPIIEWLPKYSLRNDALPDITGGLTVGIMHIPQGLAFAMLASLPPVTGLYTALVPIFIYMLMGTSRYLSQGSFAVICLMVAQVSQRLLPDAGSPSVQPNMTHPSPTPLPEGMMWSPFEAQKIDIAVSLALLIGFIQVAMGVLRLGFVATYLSDPLISGFTTGCAFLVILSQMKHILGLKVPQFTGIFFSVKMIIHMLKNIASSNVGSIITGTLSLAFLIGVKTFNERFKSKLPFPVPGELLVVIIGTSISYGGKINAQFGVQILGKIPKGVPPISVPSFSLMSNMITDAFVIAIVIFATNISLSKMFAKKNGQTIDANQELIAYGACNIGISFFSGFAICNALARTVVQENLAHTQLCNLVIIGLILLVLLFIADLFFHLPKAILAAIIIANLLGLLKQFSRLKDLWKICRTDAIVWFVTCFGVILLGIDKGLGCGVLCAVLMVVVRSSSPKYSILGHVPDTDLFKDIDTCPTAYELRGIKIIRFESSLYYVNTERFKSLIQSVTSAAESCPGQLEEVESDDMNKNAGQHKALTEMEDSASHEVQASSKLITNLSDYNNASIPSAIHTLIIDAGGFTLIDSMGMSTLKSMINEYKTKGIQIYLANCSHHFQEQLIRGDFLGSFDTDVLFITIHDAVVYTASTVCHKLKQMKS